MGPYLKESRDNRRDVKPVAEVEHHDALCAHARVQQLGGLRRRKEITFTSALWMCYQLSVEAAQLDRYFAGIWPHLDEHARRSTTWDATPDGSPIRNACLTARLICRNCASRVCMQPWVCSPDVPPRSPRCLWRLPGYSCAVWSKESQLACGYEEFSSDSI